MNALFSSCLFFSLATTAFASRGDRSTVFKNCLKTCNTSCIDGVFDKNQTLYMKALGWTCIEECKYSCMWKTVEVAQQNDYKIPQFYGKWPFTRILGCQEPASTLFSVLNGISHLMAFKQFTKRVPREAPMFNVVLLQLVAAVNAWFWSSIFHTRDFVWTERLDYFCATSLVVVSLYYALHRWTMEFDPDLRANMQSVCRNFLIALYVAHVSYLSFRKFDYGFNMKVNVGMGGVSTFLWVAFWYKKRRTNTYAWKILTTVLLTNLFLTFELFDFPPIGYWLIDAHALWHLCTIPLPFLLYSFDADDCLYLLKRDKYYKLNA